MPSSNSDEKAVYQSYLLRFWRAHERMPWQAVLIHVLTGEERRFSSPDSLFLYLHRQTIDSDSPTND